jgi:hypothetical protein
MMWKVEQEENLYSGEELVSKANELIDRAMMDTIEGLHESDKWSDLLLENFRKSDFN